MELNLKHIAYFVLRGLIDDFLRIIISTLTYKNTWENIVYINNNLFMFC